MAVTNPSAATYTAPTKDTNGNPVGTILGYEVVITNGSGTEVVTVADTSFEVGASQVTPIPQNLPPGEYKAAVRAKNAVGMGKLGPFVAFTVTPPAAVPEPPSGFSLA